MKTPVTPAKDGITLSLYVQPGSARSGWCGIHSGLLRLKVAARPVEGEANQAICLFLANFFKVPKSAVTVIYGSKGRNKSVLIQGDTARLLAQIQPLVHGSSA